VKLIISDSHEGIKAAAAKSLKAAWQRCPVHFMRNALARTLISRFVNQSNAIRYLPVSTP